MLESSPAPGHSPDGGGAVSPSPRSVGGAFNIIETTLIDAMATAPIKTPTKMIFFLSTSPPSASSVIFNRSFPMFFFVFYMY